MIGIVLQTLLFGVPGAIYHFLMASEPIPALQWLAFVALTFVVPQRAIQALLGLRSGAIAFSLNCFGVAVITILAALFRFPHLVWFYPIACLVVLWLKRNRLGERLSVVDMVAGMAFSLIAFTLLYFVRKNGHEFSPDHWSVLELDVTYWMGNAAAFFIGFPTPDLRVLGHFTSYHTLYSQFAFMARVLTGLELYYSIAYLLSGFFISYWLFALREFLQNRGVRDPLAALGAVGAALLTTPFLVINMQTHIFQHWASGVNSVGNILSWILIIGLFELLEVKGRALFLIVPIAFALTAAKISTAMCAVGGAGLYLLYLTLKTRRSVYVLPALTMGIAAWLAKRLYYDFGMAGNANIPIGLQWTPTSQEFVLNLRNTWLPGSTELLQWYNGRSYSLVVILSFVLLFVLRQPYYLVIAYRARREFLPWVFTAIIALLCAFTFNLNGDDKHFYFLAIVCFNYIFFAASFAFGSKWEKMLAGLLTLVSAYVVIAQVNTLQPHRGFEKGGGQTIESQHARAFRFIRDHSSVNDLVIFKHDVLWRNSEFVPLYTHASALTERQSLLEGTGYTLRKEGEPRHKESARKTQEQINALYGCKALGWFIASCPQKRKSWIIWDHTHHGEFGCLGDYVREEARIESISVLTADLCVDAI
jgi:hypothetical protein